MFEFMLSVTVVASFLVEMRQHLKKAEVLSLEVFVTV